MNLTANVILRTESDHDLSPKTLLPEIFKFGVTTSTRMPDMPIIMSVTINRPRNRLLPMVTDLHDSGELGPRVIDIGEKVQAYPAQPLLAQLPHHGLSVRT